MALMFTIAGGIVLGWFAIIVLKTDFAKDIGIALSMLIFKLFKFLIFIAMVITPIVLSFLSIKYLSSNSVGGDIKALICISTLLSAIPICIFAAKKRAQIG